MFLQSEQNTREKQQTSTPTSKSHIHQVSSEQCEQISSSSDDEYLYTLNNTSTDTKTPEVCVKVNGISIKMIVDTGASTDILEHILQNKTTEEYQATNSY